MSKSLPLYKVVQKRLDKLALILRENLSGVRVIRAFARVEGEKVRFKESNEEIEFFRIIKPQILGKLIYYNKVYRIETSCPVNGGKMYYKYFSGELQHLKNEYKDKL